MENTPSASQLLSVITRPGFDWHQFFSFLFSSLSQLICKPQSHVFWACSRVKKTINVRYSGILLSLSSLCSLAKATCSTTTEAIVNEFSLAGKLICCFLEPALSIMLEISPDAWSRDALDVIMSSSRVTHACDVTQNELDPCCSELIIISNLHRHVKEYDITN